MKKMLMLLIFAFLITGCSVNYELNIDKQLNLSENIILNATTDTDVQKILDFNQYIPINIEFDEPVIFKEKADGVQYYNINKKSDNSSLKFNYSYDVDEFNFNIFAKSCYQYVTVMDQDNEKELLLSTSREFLCFDKYDNLDDVTVTITSKYKLKETNADEVSRHTYRWFINKGNAKDKYLYLLLNTGEKDLNLWERILEGDFTNTFTIFLAVFLIGGIIIFLFKKKGDRRNRV